LHRLPAPSGNGARDPAGHLPLVLVCDDTERDLIAMEQLLRRHGYRVVPTRSVAEAERRLAEWDFSAVVADLRLGHGKPDGLALLVAAAQVQPGATRVLVTADPAGAELAKLADGVLVDKSEDTAIMLIEVLRAAGGG
jgi:DNA-binding NtrC family response regulator